MEAYFATLFDDIRYERSSTLLLSLPDADILKQYKLTDVEFIIIKNLAFEKLDRQRRIIEYVAVFLIE